MCQLHNILCGGTETPISHALTLDRVIPSCSARLACVIPIYSRKCLILSAIMLSSLDSMVKQTNWYYIIIKMFIIDILFKKYTIFKDHRPCILCADRPQNGAQRFHGYKIYQNEGDRLDCQAPLFGGCARKIERKWSKYWLSAKFAERA